MQFKKVLSGALCASALAAVPSMALASSHREAPAISTDPVADNTDVWVGMVPENDGSTRTAFNYKIVGRLKSGITPEQGKANLASVAAGLEQQYPENKNRGYTLVDLRERMVGSYRSMLYTLGGAVLLVLLIACANVSNLLLARALNRKRELAIRMALRARARARAQRRP